MALATNRSNTALGIELDAGEGVVFGPGDTITGRVYRRVVLLTPDATVRVSLRGRTSSKFNHNVYRDHREHLQIIDHRDHSEVLHCGPLHIKNGDRVEWSFTLTLPTHVEPGIFVDTGSVVLRPEKYLGRDAILPPSCSDGFGSVEDKEFIEYFVQADLESHRSNHDQTFMVKMPFSLQCYTPDDPIDDFFLSRLSVNRLAASHRLLPDDEKPSKGRAIGRFIGAVSKPEFAFRLHVDYPTVLQVNNPAPISVCISAEPRWDRTTEALRGRPQVMRVVDVEFALRRTIDVKRDSFASVTEVSQSYRIEQPFKRAIQQLKEPLIVPWGEESDPLDIGAMAGLRLESDGSLIEQRSLNHSRSICDFEVGFTKLTHHLCWVITLEIAGERVMVRPPIHPPVTVLPPSECTRKRYGKAASKGAPPPMQSSAAWIRPPEEMEAPPSFEDVQREDEKAGWNNLARVENGESSASAKVDEDQ